MDKAYDVNVIFAEMEQELIASYRRNMQRHLAEEIEAGFNWPMWQQKKLADLQQYRNEARRLINKSVNRAVFASNGILVESYTGGKTFADAFIKSFRKGVQDKASFGRMDRRKVDAMLDAVTNDFQKAGSAALRLIDDQYRRIVFKTQFAYAAGATTLYAAVDKSARDFLEAGINCIQYKNGANVNIASYAEMVLRTSSKRAYLAGEGARNAELGISLVQITAYGACSDTCLPWQGRVFVDDVYAGGKADDKHPLLSEAMAGGLFHPNCRHTSQPWFEGISELPELSKTNDEILDTYNAEQRQREIERNIRKYKRVEAGSLDEENRVKAGAKVREWQGKMREHLDENDFLSRRYVREKI